MAELLVMAVSKTHDAGSANDHRWQRGMVAVIKEDGAPWSARERQSPRDGGNFCIIKLPGVEASRVGYMLDHEYDDFMPRVVSKKRANVIDIDALPSAIRTGLTNDGERITNIGTIEPRVKVLKTNLTRVSL